MEAKAEEKTKGFFGKLKDNVDDHEEQMVILGAMVRLGVVVWSGFIITLNYVELPMFRRVQVGISRSLPVFLLEPLQHLVYLQVTGTGKRTVTKNQNNEEMAISPGSVNSNRS